MVGIDHGVPSLNPSEVSHEESLCGASSERRTHLQLGAYPAISLVSSTHVINLLRGMSNKYKISMCLYPVSKVHSNFFVLARDEKKWR